MTKQIIIVIIVALIFFCFGLAVASSEAIKSTYLGQLLTKTGGNTFEAGWQAAKQRLIENDFTPSEAMEIKIVSGQIEEIKDNQISLKIYPFEPLADPDLDNRIIEIDENTKAYQLVKENEGQIMFAGMCVAKKEAGLSDIQIGQSIKVTAQENIRNTKQFKAIEVEIHPVYSNSCHE